MDFPKLGKGKKQLISKTWERCKFFSWVKASFRNRRSLIRKSKSWGCDIKGNISDNEENNGGKSSKRVIQKGCFSIYVGSERQKFVINTEHVNHPLFKTLLEEAESEYGYNSEGPLVLPCEVDYFTKVLMEVDCEGIESQKGCYFHARNHSSYHLLTHPRVIAMNSRIF